MSFTLPSYLPNATIIEGAPKTVVGKQTFDGVVEDYGNYAEKSRKEINYHYVNSTDVSAIRNAFVSGVVGSGINIQSRSADKNINQEFESLLKEHAKSKNFDITGRFHRNEFLRQIIGFETVNGGVIVRHHYSSYWKIPYRLELVGIDMIDTAKSDHTISLQNGIKRNKWGRITHLYLYTDYDKTESKAYSMKNMSYYMNSWMSISQYTAVSRLVTILPTLGTALQYRTAEVQAALEKAKAGVYWSTELYGTILQALNDEFQNANATPNEKIVEAKTLLEGLASRGVSAQGATPIPQDDKIYAIDAKSDSVYDTLTNQSQKSMASSVGLSQVSAYKDIGIGNYSSIKSAISQDEESYRIDFDRLTNSIINEYLERLYMVGVQTGKLSTPREEYFNDREIFHLWDILRQSKQVIDEAKDSIATAKNLESGTTTLSRVYASKGLDYVTEKLKQVQMDIELELETRAMYDAAGLDMPSKEEDGEVIEEPTEKDDDEN